MTCCGVGKYWQPYLDQPQNHTQMLAISGCNLLINTTIPHKSNNYILQLWALGTHTANLMFCSPHIGEIFVLAWRGCRFWSDLDVGACILYESVPIETFNISFESHKISNNPAKSGI